MDQYGRDLGEDLFQVKPDFDAALDAVQVDERLTLILMSCHPVLPAESRVGLTLKVVGGLSTEEIARAYLVAPATIAQRIVRAKRTLREARVPFVPPEPSELPQRLASVLPLAEDPRVVPSSCKTRTVRTGITC